MKKAAGILLKLLAVIVALLLLAALLCGIFLACTPAQLGMDKIAVTPRYTVGGLGLSDVRWGSLLNLASSMVTPPLQKNIAPLAYSDEDARNTDAMSAQLGIEGSVPQYKKLLYGIYVGGVTQNVTLKQSQAAYALSAALMQFYSSWEAGLAAAIVDIVEILRTLNATVVQLSFAEGEQYVMKMVIKMDISAYVAEINQSLPLVQLQGEAYCTLYNRVAVGDEAIIPGVAERKGVLQSLSFEGMEVNGNDNADARKVLDALFMLLAEEDDEPATVAGINDGICTLVSHFLKNVGSITSINTADGTVTFAPNRLS